MYYVLSEADKIAIEQLLAEKRSKRTPLRTQNLSDNSQSPEVYIARTPYAGIPALALEPGTASGQENDQPGYADCTIYQVLESENVPTLIQTAAINQRVYNLSESSFPGNVWVLAVREKYGVYVAVRTITGRTTCKSFYDPCTGVRESLWFESGILIPRTDPCPECEDIPDAGTSTSTGTGTTNTPVVELRCPGASNFPFIPTELCLTPIPAAPGIIGSSILTVGSSAETWGCPTTWSKTVRMILQLGESELTGPNPHLIYRGQVIGPPGSLEGGAFDPQFYGPGYYNQPCQVDYTLTIRCYSSTTNLMAELRGNLSWRHLDTHGFDTGPIIGGLNGAYDLRPSNNPAIWGGSTNLEFSHANNFTANQPLGFSGGIETWRITAGPCVPCPYPPEVNYNTYAITGTTSYVIIEGQNFSVIPSENEVIFNLGAVGVVVESTTTKLTVLFTTRPTSTGALMATVVVNGCCNNAPGSEAIIAPPDDEDESCIDLFNPLVISPPFNFSCSEEDEEPGTGTDSEEESIDIIEPLIIAPPFDFEE